MCVNLNCHNRILPKYYPGLNYTSVEREMTEYTEKCPEIAPWHKYSGKPALESGASLGISLDLENAEMPLCCKTDFRNAEIRRQFFECHYEIKVRIYQLLLPS